MTNESSRGPEDTDESAAATSAAPETEQPAPRSDRGPLLRVELDSHAAQGAFLSVVVLSVVVTLHLAKSVLLPLVVALLLAALLSPLVRRLETFHVPAPVGAALVLASLLGLGAWTVYGLSGPAATWLEKAPGLVHRLEHKLLEVRKPVSEAAEQVERLTSVGDRTPGSREVKIERPKPLDVLLSGTTRLGAAAIITLALVFFFLATGRTFLASALEALPDRPSRRVAMSVLRRIGADVSIYLLTIVVINTALALTVGGALHLAGMPNPFLWGALAGLLNFIPYLGAMTTGAILTVVALLSFENPWHALGVVALFAGITVCEGVFVTPAIVGRRMKLHPIVVFVSLMFWGWLWGIPGALLAVPLTASLKIVGDEVGSLRPLAQVLGR